jgi:hypothetical protein
MEANEHSHILNSIEEVITNQKFIFERLSKIENDDKETARNAIGDKALIRKLAVCVEDNWEELKNHCKDAHISQGQVKKWIHELFFGEVKKIEEASNDKCQG